MKRLLIGALAALSLFIPMPVNDYKNQKAGWFRKTVDIGKNVNLPDGMKLKCAKDGTRARWKMNH